MRTIAADAVAAAQRLGPLKALVHAAGITQPAVPIAEMAVQDWEQVLRVNLTGSFVLAQAAIPALIAGAPSSMVHDLVARRQGRLCRLRPGAQPRARRTMRRRRPA